jgi:hypothetical protein
MKCTDSTGPRITEKAHEEQLWKFLDPSTGKRRLTCRSRNAIPFQVEESERAQEYQGVTFSNYFGFW